MCGCAVEMTQLLPAAGLVECRSKNVESTDNAHITNLNDIARNLDRVHRYP